jgi:prepilin-type N-terminal cleavage/methylation domain-containing protein
MRSVKYKIGSRKPGRIRHKPAVPGFTIVELLVVMGIIVIMATVAIPGLTRALTANRVSSAKSAIRNALVRAQAHAIEYQRAAGVRFQFDRDGWQTGRQYLVLIEKGPLGGTLNEYNTIPDINPIALQTGVGVLDADLDWDNDGFFEDSDMNTFVKFMNLSTFSILFSPTGQLAVENVEVRWRNNDSIFGDQVAVEAVPVAGSFSPPILYHDNATTFPPSTPDSVTWCNNESSERGLYIFEIEAMEEVDIETRYTNYIQSVIPLWVNRYTGGFIEEEGL